MIINHNLMANNAIRNMNINSGNASNSMQKLSSGLRINKAGDDAAGLAISEKMRGQIRGLDQASSNSQDAISMIQTAEGALNETHSILQRMRELAVQSSTDTNTADDRQKIQAETDQLAKEITRISNTTEFNTQNLLAGGLNDTFQIGANQGQNINLKVVAMDAKSLGVAGDDVTTAFTGTNTLVSSVSTQSQSLNGVYVDKTYTAATTAAAATAAVTKSNAADGASTISGTYTGSSDKTFQVKINASDAAGHVTAAQFSTDGGSTWQLAAGDASTPVKFDLGDGIKWEVADTAGKNLVGDTFTFSMAAEKVDFSLSTDAAGANKIGNTVTVHNNQSAVTIGDSISDRTATVGFTFATIAASAGTLKSDQITQTTQASTIATIGANGTVAVEADTKKGLNVSTQSAANLAITTIDKAITTVSTERSKLGAYQNRLEHTIANLGTSSENLTSSESRIRDVDMAKEMSTFSKNNILSQAAQAMLAQANQQPQQVLQLLR